MKKLTFLGSHGTTSNIASKIQQEGFKKGTDGLWSSGCYFFNESTKYKNKTCACAWALSNPAQRHYFNDTSDKVCIYAEITCYENLFLDLEKYRDIFVLARNDAKIYCKNKKIEKKFEREYINKQMQLIINKILEDAQVNKDDIVLRAFIPFPENSGQKFGYCLVVKNVKYIKSPPYEVMIC